MIYMLEQQDKEWIEARFVHKDTCNETQEKNAAKFANDDTRIKLFEQKINIRGKLFWVIATSTLGQFAASIFELLKG